MPGQFLAEFELYVTLAIARLGDDAYGTAIRHEIEGRTGRPVAVGALYTTLARLEKKGWVVASPRESEPGQPGRPRKYCALSPAGEDALSHSMDMLGRMSEGLTIGRPGAV